MTSSSPRRRCDDAPVSLVCFDLGGVLVRICRSWEEACDAAGVEVRGDSASEAMRDARRRITSQFAIGAIDSATWAHAVAEASGGQYTVEEIIRIHDAWLICEYEGVGPLIDRIKRAGVAVACLSNTNHDHWVRLAHLIEPAAAERVEPEFASLLLLDHVHASHLLGVAKPDPAIYRAFEEVTGHSGGDILFFDDLEENVRAAREAGWRAEQIDHTCETAAQIEGWLIHHGVFTAPNRF